MSYFERSLLEPNSARLTPGPEGDNITQLIPTQRSPRASPGADRVIICNLLLRLVAAVNANLLSGWLLPSMQTFNRLVAASSANLLLRLVAAFDANLLSGWLLPSS